MTDDTPYSEMITLIERELMNVGFTGSYYNNNYCCNCFVDTMLLYKHLMYFQLNYFFYLSY